MTAINPGCNSRSVGMRRPLLAFTALAGFLAMVSCGGSDSAPSTLRGERKGERGAPCVTYMDCVAELECVDGRCGIFGESQKKGEPGVCPAEPEPGGGQQPDPGSTGSGTPTTGGGTPTTGGGTSSPTGAPSTTTTTTAGPETGTSSDDGQSSDTTKPPIPPGCEKLPKKYQLVNPFDVADKAVVEAGRVLYDEPPGGQFSCALGGCHGPMGIGSGDPATALNTEETRNTPGCVLLEAILEGVKGEKNGKLIDLMPGYKDDITIEQAWKMVTYIRSL